MQKIIVAWFPDCATKVVDGQLRDQGGINAASGVEVKVAPVPRPDLEAFPYGPLLLVGSNEAHDVDETFAIELF